jgi:outer membrane protein assembly factor BamB
MVALDKRTGAPLWVNKGIGEPAAFCSAVLAGDLPIRQVITLTTLSIVSVEASTGRFLWRYPFTNRRENNIPTPIYTKGYVFATTGYGGGSVLLKLLQEGTNVSVSCVWASTELDNAHGGVVLVDGLVYGASHEKPAWVCLDVMTGVPRYREKGIGMGSLTYADGMLYCLAERGTMALVTCTPERYGIVSRFELPKEGEGMFWAHPVVCSGRLYIRHADRLYAYEVKAR